MNTTDLRFQKAEYSIKTAFLALLKEKGFQKIAATDIIKLADINRSTFYAHYLDKYDLMDKLGNELLANIYSMSANNIANSSIKKEHFRYSLMSFFPVFLNYMHDNGELFLLLFGPNGDPSFSTKLQNTMKEFWTTYHISLSKQMPDKYAQSAVIGMITSLLSEWINSGFDKSVDEFAAIISHFLNPIYEELLF